MPTACSLVQDVVLTTPPLIIASKKVTSDLAGNATAGKWWQYWDSKVPEVPEDGVLFVTA
jgi:hypothetical protein